MQIAMNMVKLQQNCIKSYEYAYDAIAVEYTCKCIWFMVRYHSVCSLFQWITIFTAIISFFLKALQIYKTKSN